MAPKPEPETARGDEPAGGAAPRPAPLIPFLAEQGRLLFPAAGAALGLYSAALLLDAHAWWDALAAALAGIAGGLALAYGGPPAVPPIGYLLGLLSTALAVRAAPVGALAFGPWIALGAARFPAWTACVALGTADVLSLWLGIGVGKAPAPVVVAASASALILLHIAAVLTWREVRARSRLALSDPLTGLANRRLLDWRLREELAQVQRAGGTVALVYLDLHGLAQVNARDGRRAGDRLLVQFAQLLRDTMRAHDVIARTGGDEFAVLAPGLGEAGAAAVVGRIEAAVERATTLLRPIRFTAGWAIAPEEGVDADVLVETAVSRVFEQKLRAGGAGPSLPVELMTALWELPEGAQQLVRLLHTEGLELEEHLSRIGRWSLELGQMVGLDPARQSALARAALLHDVGKLTVPRSLLRKPGPLTPDEQRVLVQHVQSGVALLRALGVDEAVVAIVAAHHERWDGTGYPAGMAGDTIPLEARILAIADGCDAMTERRPYRKAWTVDEAIADVQLEGGRQFDPRLVNLIIPVLSASP